MGRYTGPKGKLMRREGQELYLKGAKTLTEKNPLKRKPQAPGQHGLSRRRLSDYGLQLREKQKVKRMYGLLEKQFRIYYEKAVNTIGVTGEVLLSLLESRLDNVIYRSGVASTRAQARQWVRHGKFLINGKKVDIPSILVKPNDVITSIEGFALTAPEDYMAPKWLKLDKKKNQISILTEPVREDIIEPMEEQLIIDFYSR